MKIGDPLDRSTDHGPQNHRFEVVDPSQCIVVLAVIFVNDTTIQ